MRGFIYSRHPFSMRKTKSTGTWPIGGTNWLLLRMFHLIPIHYLLWRGYVVHTFTLFGCSAYYNFNIKNCSHLKPDHRAVVDLFPVGKTKTALCADLQGKEKEGVAEPDRSSCSAATACSRSMASTAERCRLFTTSGANRDLLR